MLSQGSPSFDTQYSLRQGILYILASTPPKLISSPGILRLDLPKDIFQRLGLEGKPISSGGRKHVPTRMRIEMNLRLPSMVTGRKGFERIRWAFKNVLNESMTWLFRDCTHPSKRTINDQPSGPITKFHPLPRSASPPTRTDQPNTLIPNLSAPPRSLEESSAYHRSDTSEDILEWLSLITLQSPRLNSTDDIDSYLSRYAIPTSASSNAITVTTLRWHGFIPASWICRIVGLCTSMFQADGQAWYAVTAVAIRTEQGGQRGEGCCLFFPLPHTTIVEHEDGNDDGSGMVLDSDTQQEHSNTELAGHTMVEGQRDFLMWDFVDCITQR